VLILIFERGELKLNSLAIIDDEEQEKQYIKDS
jgi:hypothetical protein